MKYKYNEDLQEVFKSNKKPSLAIERLENNKKISFWTRWFDFLWEILRHP